MSEVVHCCQDRMVYQSRAFDLPQAEIRCMMLFAEQPQLTVTQIAEGLEVTKSRASNLLGNMSGRNLVFFKEDPSDARVKLVGLTRRGKMLASRINSFVTEIHGAVIAELDPADRAMVIQSLQLLRDAMDKIKSGLKAGDA